MGGHRQGGVWEGGSTGGTDISMGGKWGVGKKEMCHRPHGVLITITKNGEQKKLVIGHEKPPTTPT